MKKRLVFAENSFKYDMGNMFLNIIPKINNLWSFIVLQTKDSKKNLRALSGIFLLSFVCRTMKLHKFFIFGIIWKHITHNIFERKLLYFGNFFFIASDSYEFFGLGQEKGKKVLKSVFNSPFCTTS
jgi:hypothetical protein